MRLSLQAVEVYEGLREQVLSGGRCRSGLATLLYHGMAQGLAMLTGAPATVAVEQETQVCAIPAEASDPALIKLLANRVLRIQSQVQHVY